MRKRAEQLPGLSAFVLACLLLPLGPYLAGQETEQKEPQVIHLFDGKSLDHFYTWLVDYHYDDPLRVFSVVDHVDGGPAIRVSGEVFGGLVTKEEYANYRLVVEYRWGLVTWKPRERRARDSGILLHCQGRDGNSRPDFNGPWMLSQECQIIEGGTGDFIMVGGYDEQGNRTVPSLTTTVRRDRDGEWVYAPDGMERRFQGGRINWFGRDPDWRDVLGFRGKQDVESPYGGWTRVEVICKGDTITNIVNGKVVNRAWNSSLTKGRILLQSEGAEIYFRRVDLYPL